MTAHDDRDGHEPPAQGRVGWRCTRCGHDMSTNCSPCPRCGYTALASVFSEASAPAPVDDDTTNEEER